MSRHTAVIWGMILCIFIVWVFSLGILVGRGFVFQSEKFQKLEERMTRRTPKSAPHVTVEESSAEESSPPALTFYKSLVQGKIQIDPSLLKKRKPSLTETESQKTSSERSNSKVTGDGSVSDKIASLSSSGKTKRVVKTLPEGASEAPPPPRNNFTIQVAALADRDKALNLVISLREKGYDAYFYHVQNKSKRYFRIRVGHYKSRAEAEAAMAGMKKTGWRDMFISRLED
ncbi:MAG: SPOR domain-containing protein [Deltaproteobacteria bacterium]|nr:SPOR domain-containing protein [Deltaproteobacteria bacterium]